MRNQRARGWGRPDRSYSAGEVVSGASELSKIALTLLLGKVMAERMNERAVEGGTVLQRRQGDCGL